MSFLLPFITPRRTSSNLTPEESHEGESHVREGETQETVVSEEESQERERENQERERENQEREREIQEREREIQERERDGDGEQPAQGAAQGQTQESVRPCEVQGTSGERRRRRRLVPSSTSTFERRIVDAIESANEVPPRQEKDPDQAFLDSLLPALKRMSTQKNAETKLKMHQLIYEAEFEC